MDKKPVVQTKIVGIYQTKGHADEANKKLVDFGISSDLIHISHVSREKNFSDMNASEGVSETIRQSLSEFFHSVFDPADREKIEEAYDKIKGNLIISVDATSQEEVDRVQEFIKETYGPHISTAKSHHTESKNTDAQASGHLAFVNLFDKTSE